MRRREPAEVVHPAGASTLLATVPQEGKEVDQSTKTNSAAVDLASTRDRLLEERNKHKPARPCLHGPEPWAHRRQQAGKSAE